ncbi:MAG: FkbM family methyltransferase [Planctomycetota bacterium]
MTAEGLKEASETLGSMLTALPDMTAMHAPGTPTYQFLNVVARHAVARAFSSVDPPAVEFGEFGRIVFPFRRMGAITSLDLFGLDELVIFGFYLRQRGRYRRVLDVGANVGLHSLLLSRCGFEVNCFEPDPLTCAALRRTLSANDCRTVHVHEAAVSSQTGTTEFVRVLGNTTGSHVAGAKKQPYGDLERLVVKTVAIGELLADVDFMKLDAEGHEADILCCTTAQHWAGTEAIVEIGSPENAVAVHRHMTGLGVSLFAQQRGWHRVDTVADMPRSYHDGSVFISNNKVMPW